MLITSPTSPGLSSIQLSFELKEAMYDVHQVKTTLSPIIVSVMLILLLIGAVQILLKHLKRLIHEEVERNYERSAGLAPTKGQSDHSHPDADENDFDEFEFDIKNHSWLNTENVKKLKELIKEALINAYKILGVDKNAQPNEIQMAWKKLALQYHPDRNRDKDTTEMMKDINVSRDILMDPTQRRRLDLELMQGSAPSYSSPKPKTSWEDTQRYQKQQQQRQSRAKAKQDRREPQISERYFVYVGGKSAKFWNLKIKRNKITSEVKRTIVTWGRLGTPGRTTTYYDYSAVKKLIEEKLAKGYQEVTKQKFDDLSTQQKTKKSEKSSQNNSEPSPVSGSRVSKKEFYRVYGRRGASPVHTRYRGKVYGPIGSSIFRNGDRIKVMLGSDGRLVVSTPNGKHEIWDLRENFVIGLEDMILECIINETL